MKRLGRLRAQWREIPLERKLSMFVAPVFVTVVGAVLISVFTGGGGTSTSAGESTRLELVDVAVADGDPIPPKYEKYKPPFVDITVRNSGTVVSVVKRVAFRVRDFGFIALCPEGAPLYPSTEYDASLPPDPRIGQQVETLKKVSQVVPPNSVDRFTIKLNVPFDRRMGGIFLYQLDVLLFYDTGEKPLEAGTVLVSVPVTYTWKEGAHCADTEARDKKTYERILALPGTRSPKLASITNSPAG